MAQNAILARINFGGFKDNLWFPMYRAGFRWVQRNLLTILNISQWLLSCKFAQKEKKWWWWWWWWELAIAAIGVDDNGLHWLCTISLPRSKVLYKLLCNSSGKVARYLLDIIFFCVLGLDFCSVFNSYKICIEFRASSLLLLVIFCRYHSSYPCLQVCHLGCWSLRRCCILFVYFVFCCLLFYQYGVLVGSLLFHSNLVPWKRSEPLFYLMLFLAVYCLV